MTKKQRELFRKLVRGHLGPEAIEYMDSDYHGIDWDEDYEEWAEREYDEELSLDENMRRYIDDSFTPVYLRDTEEQEEAEREREREEEEIEEWMRSRDAYKREVEPVLDEVIDWLDEHPDYDYTIKESVVSAYLTVTTPDDDVYKIRFSDHPPKIEYTRSGKPYMVGGYDINSGDRYDAPDVSVHTGSGVRCSDVIAVITGVKDADEVNEKWLKEYRDE